MARSASVSGFPPNRGAASGAAAWATRHDQALPKLALGGMSGCGSGCAVVTEDYAEWVTGGVSENTKAGLTFTSDTSGAQGEQFLLGLVGIAHADVEVQLLGI